MHESSRCWQPMSASAWAVSTRHSPSASFSSLLVRHQAPGSGTFRCQLADARALFRIEVDTHVFLIAGHGGQRLLGQGQQLRGMQGQFATDHLARHLLHQLQQFLATRLFVLGTKALE